MSSGRIVMHGYGPPSVLKWERGELPPLQPDEVRLRTLASAINHSDLEIRAGNWPVLRERPFPYVPGLEVVGEVVERGSAVSEPAIGDRATTMMQGLGGVRALFDGGYAEHVTVRADTVARVPAEVDALDLAAVGLAGVTAHGGFLRAGSLAGRAVVITGAGGGVGSAAIALAKLGGAARVIAVVSRPEQRAYVLELGADEARVARSGSELAKELPEWSVDVVLDSVAGSLFDVLVKALVPRGVLSLVGAVAGSPVELDVWKLTHGVVLTGYTTEELDGPSLRSAIDVITRALMEKKLRAPARTVLPLREAARAHEMLEAHQLSGRVVLVP